MSNVLIYLFLTNLKAKLSFNTASRHIAIGIQPFMRPELGWQLLSGDFFTGPEGENV